MKKVIITFSLLVVIILSFTLVIFLLLARGSEDNFFNTKYRSSLAQYPILRKIIKLHFDGDGRADYLGNRYSRIMIEVDRMENLAISKTAMELLKQRIEGVTGKEVLISYSDTIPYKDSLTQEEIDALVKKHNEDYSGYAEIYLLYLSQFENEIDHLGSTYQEYGILLFDSALKNFTKRNPHTFDYYVQSTALHEFGHQIGLPHNEIPNCLLNEHLESTQAARESISNIITDFCEYEKQLIESLR